LTAQRFQLPIISRLSNLGLSYSISGSEIVIHDWDRLSASIQDLTNDAMRLSSYEASDRLGTLGPFIPITLTRKLGILSALGIEENGTFKLPAGKTLEVWFMGGNGEGSNTKIRFQNTTDGTTIHQTTLPADPGTLEGDGINPLARAKYVTDKRIAFQAVNDNLLSALILGGFGVFTLG